MRGRRAVESLLSGVPQEEVAKESERIHLFTVSRKKLKSSTNSVFSLM